MHFISVTRKKRDVVPKLLDKKGRKQYDTNLHT